MWEIEVVCSDPDCTEELQLWVEELDEAELVACECGCGLVTMRVAVHEPLQPVG
jgi:hypothetical protein